MLPQLPIRLYKKEDQKKVPWLVCWLPVRRLEKRACLNVEVHVPAENRCGSKTRLGSYHSRLQVPKLHDWMLIYTQLTHPFYHSSLNFCEFSMMALKIWKNQPKTLGDLLWGIDWPSVSSVFLVLSNQRMQTLRSQDSPFPLNPGRPWSMTSFLEYQHEKYRTCPLVPWHHQQIVTSWRSWIVTFHQLWSNGGIVEASRFLQEVQHAQTDHSIHLLVYVPFVSTFRAQYCIQLPDK